MASGLRRVSIGFQGGQVLALRVSDEQLAGLNQALVNGSGWHDVEAEDGPARVYLDQVVYVTSDKDESQVGFG
jgi:hypothetical protein